MNELDAAWAFEVALQDRCATRREAFEWGTAIFRTDLPRVYDQNLLRVERGFDEIGARELAREADRLQRPAGLAHRKVVIPHEAAGERLSPDFARLSWRRARHVLMAHRGPAPDPPDHPVGPPDPAALRRARVQTFARDLGTTAAGQVASSLELVAGVVRTSRTYAVQADGEVVSWCELYEEDGIGQVEDVVTVPERRRRGLGRAVVAAATRASIESGNRLTFLVADDDDWPKDMYARLGYQPLGRRYEFTRT